MPSPTTPRRRPLKTRSSRSNARAGRSNAWTASFPISPGPTRTPPSRPIETTMAPKLAAHADDHQPQHHAFRPHPVALRPARQTRPRRRIQVSARTLRKGFRARRGQTFRRRQNQAQGPQRRTRLPGNDLQPGRAQGKERRFHRGHRPRATRRNARRRNRRDRGRRQGRQQDGKFVIRLLNTTGQPALASLRTAPCASGIMEASLDPQQPRRRIR